MREELYLNLLIISLFILCIAVLLLMITNRLGRFERRLAVLEDRIRPKTSDDELDYDDLFGQE